MRLNVAYIILLFVLISSCSLHPADSKKARQIAESYFRFYNEENVDSLMNIFSEKRNAQLDTMKFVSYLKLGIEKAGKVTNYQMTKYESKVTNDSKQDGEKSLILTYKVTHASGFIECVKFYFNTSGGFNGKIDGYKSHNWTDADEDKDD